jgi:hypothetical protein
MSQAVDSPTTPPRAHPTPRRDDLAGRRFGRWTALRAEAQRAADRQIVWLCRCDCGTERGVKAGTLRRGNSTSCGCAAINSTGHPLYRRWLNMVGRCTKKDHPDWENYGARGITVCGRWLSFDNFLSDLDESFTPGMQLDRINNEGNYEPGNVRWATPKTNSRNRRKTVVMETPWGRLPLAEVADRMDIDYDVLDSRRRRGWSYARLFGITNP